MAPTDRQFNTVNGSTATYRRELTSQSLRDMVGQTIDVYGSGIHD